MKKLYVPNFPKYNVSCVSNIKCFKLCIIYVYVVFLKYAHIFMWICIYMMIIYMIYMYMYIWLAWITDNTHKHICVWCLCLCLFSWIHCWWIFKMAKQFFPEDFNCFRWITFCIPVDSFLQKQSYACMTSINRNPNTFICNSWKLGTI